jgi:phosphoribosylformimino-5-aminoimidazole carboxamide ribotide isomerase
MALHWQSLGATRLHIVDLDGAAQGELRHASFVAEVARSVQIPLQLGGGLRSLEAIEEVLGFGVERAILGTAAIVDRALIAEACRKFAKQLIVSIDARGGLVASHGWKEATNVHARELVAEMASLGVKRFIYTDIARDGTLTSPDFRSIEQLATETDLPIIAAGGISSLEHIKRLAGLGVEGAIVGRALYTGALDLKEALTAVTKP